MNLGFNLRTFTRVNSTEPNGISFWVSLHRQACASTCVGAFNLFLFFLFRCRTPSFLVPLSYLEHALSCWLSLLPCLFLNIQIWMFDLATGKNTVVATVIHTVHRPLGRPKNLCCKTQMYDSKTEGLLERFFSPAVWDAHSISIESVTS